MSTNNIKDVKTVDSENFDYLLAESNFRIESVFRSRNKAVIEPNVPVITEKTDLTAASNVITPDQSKTKVGATFSFIIDASEYQLLDLRDAEFDIQAEYAYVSPAPGGYVPDVQPSFGNQCLLSLFQNIELFIDGVSIARNAYPGFSSNAEYALRYPHCKTLEKDFEIHGFVSTDAQRKFYSGLDHGATTAVGTIGPNMAAFSNQSITLKVIPLTDNSGHLVCGIITQRMRLSDIFSVVNSLPPIYNHKVEIRFQRTPHNYICCNTNTLSDVANPNGRLCQFLGFMKFKLFEDVYNTTDQFVATAKQYYSKPIETLITQDRQLLVPIISKPEKASQQSFNLNIDTAYKNKLLTICIPRTTDFASQANKIDYYCADANNAWSGIDNNTSNKHYDTYKAPANSYTYGGLRYLDVISTNGLILYRFDMENDGVNNLPNGMMNNATPISMINCGNDSNYIPNYQDVYRQYVKARLHFQQSEDEAIDFETFLKEYCIYCIDLSCFNLSPNENIKITMGFTAWDQRNYSPYYAYNSKEISGVKQNYMSSSIICNLFCDKVLRLLPNRRVELADLMTTNTVEVDNSTMA
jgi:hypothetical protein